MSNDTLEANNDAPRNEPERLHDDEAGDVAFRVGNPDAERTHVNEAGNVPVRSEPEGLRDSEPLPDPPTTESQEIPLAAKTIPAPAVLSAQLVPPLNAGSDSQLVVTGKEFPINAYVKLDGEILYPIETVSPIKITVGVRAALIALPGDREVQVCGGEGPDSNVVVMRVGADPVAGSHRPEDLSPRRNSSEPADGVNLGFRHPELNRPSSETQDVTDNRPTDNSELRTDGPTLDEFVKAGYNAKNYPPNGYAVRE